MGILTIDDRDPLVSYSPINAWNLGGVANEYNGTTSVTFVTGSTVNLSFSGTSVSVFGTIRDNGKDSPPSSSYSIDNGFPTVFSATQTSATQYHQRFYSSGILTPTTHTLVITVLLKNATYVLDYITVIPPDLAVISSSFSSSSSRSSSSFSSSFYTATSSSAKRTTTLPSTTGSSTSSTASQISSSSPVNASSTSHVAAIVGGVIGSTAFIIIVFFVILVVRKHRREKKFERKFGPRNQSLWTRYTPSSSQLTPFIMSQYRPKDNNQFRLTDNPKMGPQTVVPLSTSPIPPVLPRSELFTSLKATLNRHTHSPSKHNLRSQNPLTKPSSSSRGASALAWISSRSVHTNLDRPPPPQYDDSNPLTTPVLNYL